MQRPDRCELQSVSLRPGAKLRNGLHISRTRIAVAYRGGKELQKMLTGLVACSGNECRNRKL